mmetsp:Transcript_34873/g.100391  ORF Transcript_34873/g.100391 Transcript_34873/m.100391 type:complete len:418 (+) Transcript_34873:615-1868(+)
MSQSRGYANQNNYDSRSVDRHDGGRNRGDHARFDRSRSYAPESERAYDHDNRDFRRGRSSSVSSFRSEPPFRRGRRFASVSRSRSPGRMLRSLPPVETREWPPCFDEEGSAFVFHPSSGMFFEEMSSFYYDPKTRLYYSAKKRLYYRYDDSQDPPFVEAQQANPLQGNPLEPAEPSVILPPIAQTVSAEKPKIAIKLKTKKIKKPKPVQAAGGDSLAILPSKVQKEQVANIQKWQEKQVELKTVPPMMGITPEVAVAEIKRTAKGEPICVVCKRKFPTLEKLRLHETKSELHQANLAKLAQSAGEKRKVPPTTPTEEQQQYIDRAEKRRNLLGPDSASVASAMGTGSSTATPESGTGLGETNVGHKLLQKMGWQGGGAIGKRSDDEISIKSTDNIRRDWDRIETIAGNGIARSSEQI